MHTASYGKVSLQGAQGTFLWHVMWEPGQAPNGKSHSIEGDPMTGFPGASALRLVHTESAATRQLTQDPLGPAAVSALSLSS